MARIVVIGGGICGLGAALLLTRDGHEVTVLERDDNPVPDSPQAAWDGWARKGVAQFRQPHNLMPGLRRILESELPDLWQALREAGASRYDIVHPLPPTFTDHSPRAIDDSLWTYTARRPAAEWVFLDAARRAPRLSVQRGMRVAGLLAGTPVRRGTPHVTGVRTDAGETLHADLVVDATGRGSRCSAWLAAIGARPPLEEQADSGFTYYTRYFRGNQPERLGPPLLPLGTISLLTLPGDNGSWSVTIFTASGDTPLKRLRDPQKWTNVVRACPLQAHWLEGEPDTDVLVMSGVVDRYRRLVVDGAPVATGLVCLADACACTNPSAGRGVTVGFLHALALRDVLRRTGDDPWALAEAFDASTERDVAPWYHAQIAVDRHRFAEMEALRGGRERPAPAPGLPRRFASLVASGFADPELFRMFMEYIGTLTPLQEIFERPGVDERIATVLEERGALPPPSPGPDRARLVELAA